MCRTCSASVDYINAIEDWAYDGGACKRLSALVRPSAISDPNTFVYIFEDALKYNGATRSIYVDVHYKGDSIQPGKAIKCFGGLWMPGVPGDMKPEQHKGNIYLLLHNLLPRYAPATGIQAVFGDRTQKKPLPKGITRGSFE